MARSSVWDGNGMVDDVDDAVTELGLTAAELELLAKNARGEASVWHELADVFPADPQHAKRVEIGDWWKRRAIRWNELAARVEKEVSDDDD